MPWFIARPPGSKMTKYRDFFFCLRDLDSNQWHAVASLYQQESTCTSLPHTMFRVFTLVAGISEDESIYTMTTDKIRVLQSAGLPALCWFQHGRNASVSSLAEQKSSQHRACGYENTAAS